MATPDQFPKAPPLRFELSEEQAAMIEEAKPPGDVALVVGYARRHPWPDPDKFTLCAWFVPMPKAEAGLMAAGIMAKTRKVKAGHPKGKRSPS
jgi:hypothetical protein